MDYSLKYTWLHAAFFALTSWPIFAVPAMAMSPSTLPYFATANLSTQRTPKHRTTRPLPWSQPCSERVTKQIHDIVSHHHQSILSQDFRLAVLRGNISHIKHMHKRYIANHKNTAIPKKGHWSRYITLQLELDDAALANRPSVIRLLIDYGAKPNFVNEILATPAIQVAARCGNIDAMRALYTNGANLSASTAKRSAAPTAAKTAIEVAVEARQNAAILWLLRHGVSVCLNKEPERIYSFITHPLAKGQLSNEVLKSLECK